MLLRHKLGLISLIYALSLLVVLMTATWCISVYFRSAFGEYQTTVGEQRQIDELRRLVRGQFAVLGRNDEDVAVRYGELQREYADVSARVQSFLRSSGRAALWAEVERAVARKNAEAERVLAHRRPNSSAPAAPPDARVFEDVERPLGALGAALNSDRRERVEQVAGTQRRVLLLLAACAIVGAILCTGGLTIMRRWIVRPVQQLREATVQIGAGHFDYRIEPASKDELGKLADEVNRMCGFIVEMQERLVQREKLETAGEMMALLAHNIRNPLAGLRALAEETAKRHEDDRETLQCQERIVNAVDRLESWFRELQQAMTPINLKPERVRIDEIIDNVIVALQPMLDQHDVRVETWVETRPFEVSCDALHVEQALVALLTNAVQASTAGQTVRITARAARERLDDWELIVEDQGVGIPKNARKKIFLPQFTTKRDGSGMGLAMVSKVVKSHGGRLHVESAPGRGSSFRAVLPGRSGEN